MQITMAANFKLLFKLAVNVYTLYFNWITRSVLVE